MKDGKIVAVGSHLSIPADATVIDGRGKVVIPGLFDAGNQLGLVEIPFLSVTDDSTEYTDPVHPELRVVDAFNSRSENIRVARPAGITYSLVVPSGGNVIAGQSAIIKLDGESAEQMVLKSPAALHINLGEASKETYGNKEHTPKTRMGEMALLRQEFLKAQHFKAETEAHAAHHESDEPSHPHHEKPGPSLKMEALIAALNREIPVVVRANRLSDIESAIRLADEFDLRLVLSEATAAWRIADQLAQRKIPVIVGPILRAPGRIELIDLRLDNAAILQNAGVTVAIQTGSSNGVRDLWFAVGYVMANGLSADSALAAVTINPARIFGLQDRIGTIEPGKDATLLLLDGSPFLVNTHVLKVFIAGKEVDLTNHQTELYELYKKKYGIH
jgi:imidazolonepropionase-like amidohydrolase